MDRGVSGDRRAKGETPAGHRAVCITCAGQAVAVRVVELTENGMARADTGASVEEVSVVLVDAVVGDLLLVQAGVAIGRVQP